MIGLTPGAAWSQGRPLPDPVVGEFRESSPAAPDPSNRARHLAADGYVFIRGALDVGVAPANMNHFVLTKQPTVIEISAIGPLAFNYVNPADDPSKK